MQASIEIETVYDMVKELLERLPHLRDSDEKLAGNIWLKELGGSHVVKEMTAFEFLFIFSNGEKLTSLESIGRARRKIQENCPALRGKKYLERMNQQEPVKDFVRNETL